MSIAITCPGCDASLAVADNLAGKKIRCRHCDSIILVSTRSGRSGPKDDKIKSAPSRAASSGSRPRPRVEDDDDDDDRPRRKSRPAKKEDSNGTIIAIVGVGAVVVLVAVIAVVVVMTRKPNEPPVAELPAPTQPFANNTPPTVPAVYIPPTTKPVTPTAPLPAPAPSNGQLDEAVLKKVKRATVHLQVTLPNNQVASGSGFFGYKPGIILTNAHVLGMLDLSSRKPLRVEATINRGLPDEQKMLATVVDADRSSDLAVLKVTPGPGLPDPLEIKSATTLTETQKVYVFGFPLSSLNLKEISVSETSVSSFRTENGQLVRVQVNGGMHPGNSGGPVVTARGDVVGVAVSGIVGTQINFAVPGDFVYILLHGRISTITTGQAYFLNNGAVAVPATISAIDPLDAIKEVALDVWTGNPGKTRPPGKVQPTEETGDTKHERFVFPYKDGEGKFDVPLPALPKGKTYWLQASCVNAVDEPSWVTAQSWSISSQPVTRNPVTLALKQQKTKRRVVVDTKMSSRLRLDAGEEFSIALTQVAELQETILNITPRATDVLYLFTDLKPRILINNESKLPSPAAQKAMTVDIRAALIASKVDAVGNYTGKQVDLSRIDPNSHKLLQSMIDELMISVESLAVPMPNRQVQPGEKWSAWRDLAFSFNGTLEGGSTEMTYTYLGSRPSDKREEAVVGLAGLVRGPKGLERRMGGKAWGTALIDVTSGVMTQAEMTLRVDLDTTFLGQPAKSIATLEVKLTRVPL